MGLWVLAGLFALAACDDGDGDTSDGADAAVGGGGGPGSDGNGGVGGNTGGPGDTGGSAAGGGAAAGGSGGRASGGSGGSASGGRGGSASGGSGAGGMGEPPAPPGGDRPADVFLPERAAPAEGWPVMVLLHGYRITPAFIRRNFPFHEKVDSHGFMVVVPAGLRTEAGETFWNAGECDCPEREIVDDVAYLRGLVEDLVRDWPVDPSRIWFAGHSNGGAMAYRLACEAPDILNGIIAIEGLTVDLDRCAPDGDTVNLLHIHGTADQSVPYEGVDDRPGAEAHAAWWATHNGCEAPTEVGEPRDLERLVPGAETTVLRAACPDGLAVELWRMDEASHALSPNDAFLDDALGFMGVEAD